MCIIISKDKNCDRLPTIGELTNCFEYNRDGAGFMYVNNNKVIIEKGFMFLDDFLNRFQELCTQYNNFKRKALVIHCRIGTSSGNTPENTHPYAITNKEKDLHKLYIKTTLGIVHNGIISAYTPTNKNSTVNDTQKFIMEYLAPIHKHYRTFYKMEKFRDGMKSITNSKFVFLDTCERTYYVGDFINENGIKFSNTSYKTFKTYYNWVSKYDDYFDYEEKEEEKDIKEIDDNYEYYNMSKNQIYLKKGWSFYAEDSCNYEEVIDSFEYVYNLNTGELYIVTDLGYLKKYEDFATVYDENGQEIF